MKVTNPKRIKIRRQRLGYTQADLAALVGCTQQYISMLESGSDADCSERIAAKIAKRLDVDLADIFEEREITVPVETSNKVAHKHKPKAA